MVFESFWVEIGSKLKQIWSEVCSGYRDLLRKENYENLYFQRKQQKRQKAKIDGEYKHKRSFTIRHDKTRFKIPLHVSNQDRNGYGNDNHFWSVIAKKKEAQNLDTVAQEY